MATLTINTWHGKRARCSKCGEVGAPRRCDCLVAGVVERMEWIIWIELQIRAREWPSWRAELLVDSERSLES